MPTNRSQKRYVTSEQWNGDIQELAILGKGASGLIFAIDGQKVAKVSLGSARSIADLETERRVYQRFKDKRAFFNCPYILSCLDTKNPRGLIFERCKGTLRSYIQKHSPLSRDEIMRCAQQAAEGLAFVHKCGIRQADVGCHNMLLDSTNTLKLADFAGSSIDGSDPSVNYVLRSRLPGTSGPSEKADIFALGSAFFEIATGKIPYGDVPDRIVQTLYRKQEFPPEADTIPDLGPIIRKCWRRGYRNALEVVGALERVNPCPMDGTHEMRELLLHPTIATTSESKLDIVIETSRKERARSTKYVQPSHRHSEVRRKYTVGVVHEQQRNKAAQSTWLTKFFSWTQPRGRNQDQKCYYS